MNTVTYVDFAKLTHKEQLQRLENLEFVIVRIGKYLKNNALDYENLINELNRFDVEDLLGRIERQK